LNGGRFIGYHRAQECAKFWRAISAETPLELRLRSRPAAERLLQALLAGSGRVQLLGVKISCDVNSPRPFRVEGRRRVLPVRLGDSLLISGQQERA
jgi:hypothetical protein